MFSIGCFDKEAIESKITLSFIFNDLRPIFSRLIFQLSNTFNDLHHIYIRNKVAIFNELKIELVNVFIDVKIDVSFINHQYKNSPPTFCFTPVSDLTRCFSVSASSKYVYHKTLYLIVIFITNIP